MQTTSAQSARPNIVLMYADDAGYADFGFMEQFTGQQTEFLTPSLDQLAQQSVVMSRGYVSSSLCSPSRAGLLTGRYQQRFGYDYNLAHVATEYDGIPVDEVLVTEALKDLGYSTGVVGKWHVGADTPMQPQNQGVDEFYGLLSGARPYFGLHGNPVQQIRRNETPIEWTQEASFNNVPEDPGLGRHLTDAFGDEASRFIADHAGEDDPFFLYVPFTAVHGPYHQAKADDLEVFEDTSLTGDRKNAAALNYGMDRAVGNILSRLEDPNGDGDMGDSVSDNTIVMFINDNGGREINGIHDNTPLRGYKGGGFEGSIRVPYLIKAPGIDPGVFDQAVSTLDVFPTLVKAAGGELPENTDGADLLPYLSGVQTGEVHETLFIRYAASHMAAIKGEWKLAKGFSDQPIELYHLNPDGSGEDVDLRDQYPEKFQELIRDYVGWEATLRKPSQTSTVDLNRFDEFRFNHQSGVFTNWRTPDVWLNNQDPSQAPVQMRDFDAYANAVVVFHPRNDSNFIANNNLRRASDVTNFVINQGLGEPTPGLMEFMLNELRFEGEFSGSSALQGTVQGNPLMFVNDLSGQKPQLLLGSTNNTAHEYVFNLDLDVVLYDDLDIVSTSDEVTYHINGQIRDFHDPRALTISGPTLLTMTGHNTYQGTTTLDQGHLLLSGEDAALDGTSLVSVGPQSSLTMEEGVIRTEVLQIDPAATFAMEGGLLETNLIIGDFSHSEGVLSTTMEPASLILQGDYEQTGNATLQIDFDGSTAGIDFEQLAVSGLASLGGQLEINLLNEFLPAPGDAFQVLTAASIENLGFDITGDMAEKFAYSIHEDSALELIYQDADFNGDSLVNSLDLNMLQSNYGMLTASHEHGDADGNQVVDGADFLVWQRQFQASLLAASQLVPEPSGLLLVGMAGLLFAFRRTR